MSPVRANALPKNERGSALLAALCFAAVFAICLSSYITLCYTTLSLSNRNLASGHSAELAEAGMETAIYSMNNGWTGWTLNGSTQTLTQTGFSYENNVSGQFTLSVANYASTTPTITAVGTVTLGDGTTVTRTLQAGATQTSAFVNALGAVDGRLKLKYGGTIDSYVSSAAPYSAATAGSAAVLLSGSPSTTTATVSLGTSTVKGYVVTLASAHAPTTSSATITASKVIASANPNQPLFTETTPLPTGTALTISGNVTLGSPTDTTPRVYTVTSDGYGDLTLSGSTTITINGPVELIVTGDLTINSSASIVVSATKNSGGQFVSSLQMHVGGNVSLAGGINNLTLIPKRVALIDTLDNSDWYTQTVAISTTTPYYGVLYFPYDSMTISSSIAIYGSVVANSISLSGTTPAIHYDVSLQTPGNTTADAAFNAFPVTYSLSTAGVNETGN